jgi:Uma2 family endonuclease
MSTVEFPVLGPVLVLDPIARDTIISQRRASGGDRYDEVWEGTYVMSPLANLEHPRLVRRLTILFDKVVESLGKGEVFPGANITDRTDDWTANYRCPDVVVVLDETRINRQGAAIVGGPDFLIEIALPGDRWPEKLPFYGSIGVRALLIIDCETKYLELFRLEKGIMASAGSSNESATSQLSSEVLPLTFQWMQKSAKPIVSVRRTDGQSGEWLI